MAAVKGRSLVFTCVPFYFFFIRVVIQIIDYHMVGDSILPSVGVKKLFNEDEE